MLIAALLLCLPFAEANKGGVWVFRALARFGDPLPPVLLKGIDIKARRGPLGLRKGFRLKVDRRLCEHADGVFHDAGRRGLRSKNESGTTVPGIMLGGGSNRAGLVRTRVP